MSFTINVRADKFFEGKGDLVLFETCPDISILVAFSSGHFCSRVDEGEGGTLKIEMSDGH